MNPSHTESKAPGTADGDKLDPSHDAISSWLLREVAQPGAAERMLLPGRHPYKFRSIELEAIIADEADGRIVGYADALLRFTEGTRLWIEIKTDDRAIGALVRQIKMYQRYIVGEKANWLVLLPYASQGAREFLAHAEVQVLCVPALPADLFSEHSRRAAAPKDDGIPEWNP